MTRIVWNDGRTVIGRRRGGPRPGLPTDRGSPNTVFPMLRLVDRDEIRVGVAALLGAAAGLAVGLLVARAVID